MLTGNTPVKEGSEARTRYPPLGGVAPAPAALEGEEDQGNKMASSIDENDEEDVFSTARASSPFASGGGGGAAASSSAAYSSPKPVSQCPELLG